MTSAVIMAGCNQKEIEQYEKQLKYYHEKYDCSAYKPLTKFSVGKGEDRTERTLIEMVLEKIDLVKEIDDIVIVGEKKTLEDAITNTIKGMQKKVKIIDQNEPLTEETADTFKIDIKCVETNSLCGNSIKGYQTTKAYQKKESALFIASDTPAFSNRWLDFFLEETKKYNNSAIIMPLASMKELPKWRHAFHRKYLFLVNDTDYDYKNSFRTLFTGRDGYRMTSYTYANPLNIKMEKVNKAYNLRKWLSPEIRKTVKMELEENGQGHAIMKYLMTKNLTIKDCEDVFTKIMCKNSKKFTIIPIPDTKSTYDYDGTSGDKATISKLLKENRELKKL